MKTHLYRGVKYIYIFFSSLAPSVIYVSLATLEVIFSPIFSLACLGTGRSVFSYSSLALRIRSSPIFPPPLPTNPKGSWGTGSSAELVPPPPRVAKRTASLNLLRLLF